MVIMQVARGHEQSAEDDGAAWPNRRSAIMPPKNGVMYTRAV